MRDSTQTTASAPSQVVGIPGYSNFCSVSSAAGVPETRSSVPVAMRGLLPEMSDQVMEWLWERQISPRTGLPAFQSYLIYYSWNYNQTISQNRVTNRVTGEG